MLLLQRTHVQFLAPTLDSSQPPVTPAAGIWYFLLNIHVHMLTYLPTHKYVMKNNKNEFLKNTANDIWHIMSPTNVLVL